MNILLTGADQCLSFLKVFNWKKTFTCFFNILIRNSKFKGCILERLRKDIENHQDILERYWKLFATLEETEKLQCHYISLVWQKPDWKTGDKTFHCRSTGFAFTKLLTSDIGSSLFGNNILPIFLHQFDIKVKISLISQFSWALC